MVTTATGVPGQVLADYQQVFSKLGAHDVRELPITGRADADSQETADLLDEATGVFFSGGDQSRLQTLVGSRVNDQLRERLASGLMVAGTSAGRHRDGPHHDPRRPAARRCRRPRCAPGPGSG